MGADIEQIQILLQEAFGKNAQIIFFDESGDGKHFYLEISSERFHDLSKVEQSKLVYKVID